MEAPYLLTPLYRYSLLNRSGMDNVPMRHSKNDTPDLGHFRARWKQIKHGWWQKAAGD